MYNNTPYCSHVCKQYALQSATKADSHDDRQSQFESVGYIGSLEFEDLAIVVEQCLEGWCHRNLDNRISHSESPRRSFPK